MIKNRIALSMAEAEEYIQDNENSAELSKFIKKFSKPVEVDKIIEITKLEPQTANKALSFLIIRNQIKETAAGYII